MNEIFTIAPDVTKKIDQWLVKYPSEQKRSAVVAALLYVQEQNQGWLSQPAMDAVAGYLQIDPIWVYEVATFYDMYELKPRGRHKIGICTNIACMLRGAEEIADCVKKRLGINFGESTPDGKFLLREMECMAACGGAPMCQIDDHEYHENLTPEKILSIIDHLSTETSNGNG
ncbi:MAG: NAD(P)H-dependent oxidoreductase subunit E [Proteobacteria bacterium]|nr:NAD(P)H-dependent oxidoreductase subunit E [Pseudomonadota bacterium]